MALNAKASKFNQPPNLPSTPVKGGGGGGGRVGGVGDVERLWATVSEGVCLVLLEAQGHQLRAWEDEVKGVTLWGI